MLPAPAWLVNPPSIPDLNISRCYNFIFSVNPLGDHIRRLDPAATGDRAILRQVYGWALRNPAIYLEGSGNRAAEEVSIHVGKFEFYDQSGAEKPDS